MRVKFLALLLALYTSALLCKAQTYSTLKGQVSFHSSALEEYIRAYNNNVAAQLLYNYSKGQFIIPIKSFIFQKALMQEHFNENYLESDIYPKATYKYTITDLGNVDLNKPGRYTVHTTGVMTIKKISKKMSVPGFITITDGSTLRIEADFSLLPSDYDIQIPRLVESKIAKSITIKVNSTLNKQ